MVSSTRLDSFLPSLVQMAPCAVQSVAPALTRDGRLVPNPSSTLSPSSSTASWVAAKVMGCDVSPALNVTVAGTPE